MRFIKPQKTGVELPELTTPAVANDIASGKEVIDGNGNKITGNVYTVEADNAVPASASLTVADGAAQMEYTFTDSDGSIMFRPGSALGLHCDSSELGNATSSDVVSGKTFTSQNGKKVAGTIPVTSSGEVVLKTVTKTIESGATIQQSAPLTADTLLKSGAIVRLSQTMASYGSATAANVLAGKTFTGSPGYQKAGTMVNQGAKTSTLNCGASYTIPAGYHNGSGKVTANSLASQTSATAAAGDIMSGKTAWVNGSKITGTLVPTEVLTGNLTLEGEYSIYTVSGIPTNKNNILIYRSVASSVSKGWSDGVFMLEIKNGVPTKYIFARYNNGLQYGDYLSGSTYNKSAGTFTSNNNFWFAADSTYSYIAW